MNTLIIIGTGLAGYNLAKEFRKLDPTRELILITQDNGHFYSKPQLSTALAQKKSPQQLVITPCEKMQEQLRATIYTHTKVIAIQPDSQTIVIETPTATHSLPYAQLVLAIGAKPRPLPLFEAMPHHFRVNNLQDYEKFIENTAHSKHCSIIGSGLVGCEFAHDLSHHIPLVSVVTPDPHPLFGLVPSEVGQSLQQVLSEKGIHWLTNTSLTRAKILESGQIQLETQNGLSFTTDHVLSAIGIAPNTALAKQSGLATLQGIVVDPLLQTSATNIYALGDCAEINGQCRQYVAPLLQCARQLAQTLSGTPSPIEFPPFPINLKVSAYPIIALPPKQGSIGEWQIESTNHSHKALFLDEEGQLLGYVLSGSCIDERQSCLAQFQARQSLLIER